MAEAHSPTELLICVKCRAQTLVEDPQSRPGQQLFDRLAATPDAPGIAVKAVECLSNCSRGCSVALRGPGKWSYVYGNLAPEDAPMLLDGARRYQATGDGLVPWRERPEHFRKNCIARIPPLEI